MGAVTANARPGAKVSGAKKSMWSQRSAIPLFGLRFTQHLPAPVPAQTARLAPINQHRGCPFAMASPKRSKAAVNMEAAYQAMLTQEAREFLAPFVR